MAKKITQTKKDENKEIKTKEVEKNKEEQEQKKEQSKINWLWHLKVLIIIYIILTALFLGVKNYLRKKALLEVEKGISFYEHALSLKDTAPILLDNLPESYAFYIKAQNIMLKSMDVLNEIALKKELAINDYDFFEKEMIPSLKDFLNKVKEQKSKSTKFIEMYNNVINKTEKIINDFGKLLKDKPLDPKKIAQVAYDNYKTFLFLFERTAYFPAMLSYPYSLEVAVDYFNEALNIDNRCVEAYYYIGKVYEYMNWLELSGRYLARAYYYGKKTKYGQDVVKQFNEDLANRKTEYQNLLNKINTASDTEAKNNLINNLNKSKERLMQAYYNLGMIYYYDKNESKAKELFENVVQLDPEIVSFTAFMAEKRINSLGKKYFEIEYDPRL